MQAAELDIKMRILLAAKKLFARQGYEATTVRQICEEAKANVALVSYHFGGKENVFNALFDTFFPKSRMREMLGVEMDPAEGLRFIIREVTLYRLSEPEMISLLQQEISFHSPRIDVIRGHVFPLWTMLRDLLKAGRDKGLFHFQSLDHVFITVLGTILFHNQSYYFEPLFTEHEKDTEKLIEDITDFVLGGLKYS